MVGKLYAQLKLALTVLENLYANKLIFRNTIKIVFNYFEFTTYSNSSNLRKIFVVVLVKKMNTPLSTNSVTNHRRKKTYQQKCVLLNGIYKICFGDRLYIKIGINFNNFC